MKWPELPRDKYDKMKREQLVQTCVHLEMETGTQERTVMVLERKMREMQARLDVPEYQLIMDFEKEFKNTGGMLVHFFACPKMKNNNGEWKHLGEVLERFTSLGLSSGLCPKCSETMLKEVVARHQNKVEKKQSKVKTSKM